MGQEDRELLLRYLLGDLSRAERQRIEKELAEDARWDTLQALENDLIDAYVRGDLSDVERRQFEQNFLDSPERVERLEVARLLLDPDVRKKISPAALQPMPEHGPWWQRMQMLLPWRGKSAMAFVQWAAGLTLIVLVVLLAVQNVRLRTELGRMRSEQSVLQSQLNELQRKAGDARLGQEGKNGDSSGPSDTEVAAFLLRPGIRRQAEGAETAGPFKIPLSASVVMLQLDMQRDQYPLYQATVETAEGKIIRSVHGLKSKATRSGGRVIELSLPAATLKRGDYIVTLRGQKPTDGLQVLDSYSLSIVD